MQPTMLRALNTRPPAALTRACCPRGAARGWRGSRRGLSAKSSDLAGSTKSPVTAELWRIREAAAACSGGRNSESLGSPEFLLQKAPAESAVTINYDFPGDPSLKERYQNDWGYVRMGIVLEDLDAIAGTVAFNHCDDGNPDTRCGSS